MKILRTAAAGVALLAGLLLIAVWARPPELIRIGANYAAKTVCSSVFIAGRDPGEVLRDDVQAPGIALLRLMRVSVDRREGVVRAGLFGLVGGGLAVARPGAGCAVVPDGQLDGVAHSAIVAARTPAAARLQPWPEGDAVETNPKLDPLLADDALTGPGARAVVVVHRGRIVAERYAPGFDAAMPLLGWSMAKSVTAGLIGVLVKEGRLVLDQRAGWPPGDARANIRIADLLSMTSGLRFNEGYGAVSDVTRMLFLQSDMAAFARAQPLEHPVGSVWSYSSGTAVILARIFQDTAGPTPPLAAVRERLFEPLGMNSAVIETDAHGTLVGSSYMYATARDWARYAQFLLQQGVWRDREILPQGYAAMMATAVAASGGQYGRGQVWLWGSDPTTPGKDPDTEYGLPADIFWMEGHDGQYVAIVPSRDLVIVRMGLTPEHDRYRPQPLVRALLDALPPH